MKMTEVIKIVSLPRSGIWRRIKEKKFPNYKVKDENGYLNWDRKDVLKWKKENEKTAQN